VEAVILIKSSLRVGLIDLSSQMFVCHELSIFHATVRNQSPFHRVSSSKTKTFVSSWLTLMSFQTHKTF